MRRSGRSPMAATPYRVLAHHHAGAGNQVPESLSLLRSFNVETNPTRPVRPSPLTASTIRDMPLDLVDRIRSFPLFASAPEEFLVAIGNHLRPQIHAAQDHILNEGDDAKAMYWLVRGVVAVTSRDGEAVYAELKQGAFFGEIGVLMNIPRTATIVARTKCLVVILKKEDLQAELPKFPDMEKAIRQEAQERLTVLKKKRQETGLGKRPPSHGPGGAAREPAPGEVATGETGVIREGGASAMNSKKRKSPSPGAPVEDPAAGSALGSGIVSIRRTLKELPLFSTLPPDILHFLGLSAQPRTYSPFTDIVRQGMPGNEIYFIVRGEAEVIHEPSDPRTTSDDDPGGGGGRRTPRTFYQRPRLRQGQYFGEVASLGLSPGRTATVRSITTVECLVIGGDALDELWRRCPPDIRFQVEETARRRYRKTDKDGDLEMVDSEADTDAETASEAESDGEDAGRKRRGAGPSSLPRVTFTTPSKPSSPSKDENGSNMAATDPDPFLSVDMENLRNRRRNSLAPPPPSPGDAANTTPSTSSGLRITTPTLAALSGTKLEMIQSPPIDFDIPTKRPRTLPSRPHIMVQEAALPDDLLVAIFSHLSLVELMDLRLISTHWKRLVSTSPKLCTYIDLRPYSRHVTDEVVISILAPFITQRPETVDLSNCFHLTDEGFSALWRLCGRNVKRWRMRSVWDVSANQILDMSENAKGLEEVDWSNCRKVGDNLLARVVGWVVPTSPPNKLVSSPPNKEGEEVTAQKQQQQRQRHPNLPPPGTVIGCPKLKDLNLSYCKHITDRSMSHLAAHAHTRLRSLSLTRCTSITDAGFQMWAPFRFTELTELCLADCTYLTDAAIVALVSAAKNLTHLDLSFCCALSDTSTEVVALGLPKLRELRLAFCGSAVSDGSLQCVALHLNELEGLSVRGCVRVTGVGVESILEGCGRLRWLDASQCRHLESWIRTGGVGRWGFDERGGNGGTAAVMQQKQAATPAPAAATTTVPAKDGSALALALPARAYSRPRRARPPVRFIIEKGADGLR